MADLAGVRTDVKTWVGRDWSGINTVIDSAINASIEMFGRTLSAVYDEAQWEHTFDSVDTANDAENFALPLNTKYILNATMINPNGTNEDVYYPVRIVSPVDAYEIDALDARGSRTRYGFDTSVTDISASKIITWNTFDKHEYFPKGRVDREGIPKFCWRIGNNVHIYPRNSENEEDWKLRILIATFPAELSADGDTNTITNNYPRALAHYAAGIVWGARLGDMQRATSEFAIAGQLLSTIAHEQEIAKLINIQMRRT